MKLKIYTDDDLLAGEIEVPQGATFVSNHPAVTTAMIKILMACRKHEAALHLKGNGDSPLPDWDPVAGAAAAIAPEPHPSPTEYSLIRQEIVEGINRFVLLGQPVGHFLTAVLSNNLKEAFGAADSGNLKRMFQIVSYCYNEIPKHCWGSPKAVNDWLELEERPAVSAPLNTKEYERQVAAGYWCGHLVEGEVIK